MNIKRWLLASAAVFVVIFILEMVIHGILLADIYQQTAAVWRPQAEMEANMWYMWLGYLILAPVFTYIYVRGYEAGKDGLAQGLRYGVIVGILLSIPQSLIWYAVLPIPGALALYWAAAGMVEVIAAGVATGLIYKQA